MEKTTCPDCNRRMMVCRRYRLEPLADYLRSTLPAVCRLAGISGSIEPAARCHGITRRMVDKICGVLREHPALIWPEIVDHDIEDAQRACEECGAGFVPSQATQRFCTKVCGRRNRDRRYQKRRWDADPEHRARKATANRDYARRSIKAQRAQRRRWAAANADKLRAKRAAWHAANREASNARRKANYWANRERELAAQKAYRESGRRPSRARNRIDQEVA